MANAEKFNASIAWLPDFIYTGGRFQSGRAWFATLQERSCDSPRVDELRDEKRIRLANRALLPGMVNAHSHAFQRVLRGRTEYRNQRSATASGPGAK